MKWILSGLCVVLTIMPVSSGYSESQSRNSMITKPSTHSVSATLDRLTQILKSKGIIIFARINHASGAKNVGLELRPTELLLFGNPKLGTPLMQSDQKIGVDLPLKVLVWQDNDGKVWLGYPSPDYLKTKYAIKDKDKIFGTMSGALNKFTDLAVNPGDLQN